jgi:hypothetical protein
MRKYAVFIIHPYFHSKIKATKPDGDTWTVNGMLDHKAVGKLWAFILTYS